MAQYSEVVRHSVVGEPEQDRVERLRGNVFGRVTMGELDVAPVLARAELARLCQHPKRYVYPEDGAGGADGLLQVWKIAPRAASDLEHACARFYSQAPGGKLAQVRWKKEYPIEQGDEAGNAIIAPRNECAFTIYPMVTHASRPLCARIHRCLYFASCGRSFVLCSAPSSRRVASDGDLAQELKIGGKKSHNEHKRAHCTLNAVGCALHLQAPSPCIDS